VEQYHKSGCGMIELIFGIIMLTLIVLELIETYR
jgi:hypothetical protein